MLCPGGSWTELLSAGGVTCQKGSTPTNHCQLFCLFPCTKCVLGPLLLWGFIQSCQLQSTVIAGDERYCRSANNYCLCNVDGLCHGEWNFLALHQHDYPATPHPQRRIILPQCQHTHNAHIQALSQTILNSDFFLMSKKKALSNNCNGERRQGDRVWNNIKTDLSLSCMIHDFIRGLARFIIGCHCHSWFSSILLLWDAFVTILCTTQHCSHMYQTENCSNKLSVINFSLLCPVFIL